MLGKCVTDGTWVVVNMRKLIFVPEVWEAHRLSSHPILQLWKLRPEKKNDLYS
jgi:hypothetical protein